MKNKSEEVRDRLMGLIRNASEYPGVVYDQNAPCLVLSSDIDGGTRVVKACAAGLLLLGMSEDIGRAFQILHEDLGGWNGGGYFYARLAEKLGNGVTEAVLLELELIEFKETSSVESSFGVEDTLHIFKSSIFGD
jgi:hypothetical protein